MAAKELKVALPSLFPAEQFYEVLEEMLNNITSMGDRVEPVFAILVSLFIFFMNLDKVHLLPVLYRAPETPQRAVALLYT